MQRKVLSIILVLNMAAVFVLSAYASEQELPQAETSIEQDDRLINNNSEESCIEKGSSIITELEKKEDVDIITTTAENTEFIETDTELDASTATETDLIIETKTELAENTDTEIGELDETATTTETMEKVETETEIETETGLVEDTVLETELFTETEFVETTDIETEELDESGIEIETEINMETETADESEIIEDSEITTEAETEVETELETESESPVVYSVEFPPIDELRFILDPYGLKGLTQGKSASLEELKSYAGKIYCNKKMMVTNKSSVPIKVKVSIQLTGDISAKESMEELESDSGNNVLMYIIPSKNDLEGKLENYEQSDLGIVVKKDEPTVFELILPESQYQWDESAESNSMKYEIADGENGHSAAFEIAGLINTKANWKNFDKTGKKIGLKISYSYEDASNLTMKESRSYGAFELLPYNGATVNVADK